VSVDRFVRSGEVGLAESKFLVAVSRDEITAWQTALSVMERYGSSLASLVETNRGAQTSDALVALGEQLRDGQTQVNINPGIASTFASLGGALVNARAQSRAKDILATSDPHVQAVLHQMADALGSSDREGLRGTVYSNFTTSLRDVISAYAAAAEAKDLPEQRALVSDYLAALDRRDAQLRSLASLRSSLLTLASAHGAAAAGAPASVNGLLSSIETRLDETKRLYEEFKKEEEKKGA
jgi:hypothetical protein